jgi:hypothetical protein
MCIVYVYYTIDYGYPLLVSLELEQSLQLQNKVYSIMKVYIATATTSTGISLVTNASNTSTIYQHKYAHHVVVAHCKSLHNMRMLFVE